MPESAALALERASQQKPVTKSALVRFAAVRGLAGLLQDLNCDPLTVNLAKKSVDEL
jgi:hypothetical protein